MFSVPLGLFRFLQGFEVVDSALLILFVSLQEIYKIVANLDGEAGRGTCEIRMGGRGRGVGILPLQQSHLATVR